ncbi:MAG: hypothetical protein HKN11_19285 [Rhizobiales bacterium]|nr:hypothetical protein [Hyphomicrobiales bacterium]
MWQAGPIGEGSAPVWINDKLVLHTSWGGHIQLVDAETGGTVNSTTIGFRIHNTGSDKTRQQLFFARGAPPPASSSEALPPDVLCRLEPQDLGVTETPVSQANAKFAVSPSGTTVAIAYQVTSPEFTVANRPSAIRVVDIATGQTIADQILPFELRTYRQAVWSPDEAMICLSTKAGHLFLDAKSLDQRALVERPYACEPKFSNDGKLILLAAWSNACIMPIATIFA